MQPWEMTAFCPLCREVFRAAKVENHIRSRHSEASEESRDRIRCVAHQAVLISKRPVKRVSKNSVNATDVLHGSKQRVGYSTTVSGGAFGQGKKR